MIGHVDAFQCGYDSELYVLEISEKNNMHSSGVPKGMKTALYTGECENMTMGIICKRMFKV